jgi:thiamine transport system substrate-binding protein
MNRLRCAVFLAALFLPAFSPAHAADTRILRVLTHDSFSASKDVIAEFEARENARVQFMTGGDAGETLNKAILSRGNPIADVLYGVDNSFAGRALAADILEPYASPAAARLPAELFIDRSARLLPVDYGYVCLNVDRAYFAGRKLAPPASLDDLARPQYRDMLVVENPATSSPGLAFLLATIARYGEIAAGGWEGYWRGLRANGALAVNGWSEAYYGEFSAAGKGKRPIVVSYATSPAAEVFFAKDPKPAEPPTAAVLAEGGSFRQIEYVGILKGGKNGDLARSFVDFMLSPRFQEDVPLQMFVYPSNPDARLPQLFTRFAPVPRSPAVVSPSVIDLKRDEWIRRWTRVFLQ